VIAHARSLLTVGLLVAGLVLAAAVLRAGDARDESQPAAERVLYLRSGEVARRLWLSFDAVAADVYWIRTIQHYGGDRKSARTTGRFELLQPLLDLTTTLDPHFNIVYRFGAIFLATDPPNGPGQPDQAISLLEKGLARNPDRWQYGLDIGFVQYLQRRDFEAAAHAFERAAAMSKAPAWLRPLAAVTLAQGGDREGARVLFGQLAGSEEGWVREAAARGLAQMDALDRIDDVQSRVDRFYALTHAYPTRWSDLVQVGLLAQIPVDPANVPLDFDPVTKRVTLRPSSPLGPLPVLRARK
jgi:tetratricopeptide (TPR) repeat protein